MHLDFPYHFDASGRSAETDDAGHIRDLIEQVLFTNPGERVNRPEFGAGVNQLVFGPASPEAAATAGFMIRGALQQYLGQRILVEDVQAEAEDSALSITIVYRSLRGDSSERMELRLGGGP